MIFISENELDKLPDDFPVWMLLDKDYSNVYLRFTGENEYSSSEIIAFTEKDDAEQMIQILKSLDLFKDKNIAVGSELLTELRAGARNYDQYLYILNHKLALNYFAEYQKLKQL